MCEKELDQPLSSPRLCDRALDVSTFFTANNCICHHGKEDCIDDRVRGFGIIRHVLSSRKDG